MFNGKVKFKNLNRLPGIQRATREKDVNRGARLANDELFINVIREYTIRPLPSDPRFYQVVEHEANMGLPYIVVRTEVLRALFDKGNIEIVRNENI